MDFWSAVQVLRRRWYALVAGLIISTGLTLVTFYSIATVYESTSVLVLTSPSQGARFSDATQPQDVEKINPLLAFDGSLTTSAQIIQQILRDPATQEQLGVGLDSRSTYQVTNGDATVSGPFLFILADSDQSDASRDLASRVVDRARTELAARQTAIEAPLPTFITTQVLVKPTVPEAKINGKIRFAGAAFVLSLIFTLTVTFAVDNVLSRRSRRPLEDELAEDHVTSDLIAPRSPRPGRDAMPAAEPGSLPMPMPMPMPEFVPAMQARRDLAHGPRPARPEPTNGAQPPRPSTSRRPSPRARPRPTPSSPIGAAEDSSNGAPVNNELTQPVSALRDRQN